MDMCINFQILKSNLNFGEFQVYPGRTRIEREEEIKKEKNSNDLLFIIFVNFKRNIKEKQEQANRKIP